MKPGKQQNTNLHASVLAALFAVPLAIIAVKLSGMAGSVFLSSVVSLQDMPRAVQHHLEQVIFIPLSAVIVSFFRLTLGIRVFSLFRPILLAIAFRYTGVPVGIAFLAAALLLVAGLRPLIRGNEYYARVPVLASFTAGLTMLPLMIGRWHSAFWLERLTHFPVIALCLTVDSFAQMLDEKGAREAVWRAICTAAVGIVIAAVAAVPGLMHVLVRYPELLILQTACVLVIARFFSHRLLENKNFLARAQRGAKPAIAAATEVAA